MFCDISGDLNTCALMIKCDSFAVIRKVFMPYTFHYIKYVSKSTAYIYSVFGFRKDSRKPVPWNVNIALNAPKIHVAKYIQFRTVVGVELEPLPFYQQTASDLGV